MNSSDFAGNEIAGRDTTQYEKFLVERERIQNVCFVESGNGEHMQREQGTQAEWGGLELDRQSAGRERQWRQEAGRRGVHEEEEWREAGVTGCREASTYYTLYRHIENPFDTMQCSQILPFMTSPPLLLLSQPPQGLSPQPTPKPLSSHIRNNLIVFIIPSKLRQIHNVGDIISSRISKHLLVHSHQVAWFWSSFLDIFVVCILSFTRETISNHSNSIPFILTSLSLKEKQICLSS